MNIFISKKIMLCAFIGFLGGCASDSDSGQQESENDSQETIPYIDIELDSDDSTAYLNLMTGQQVSEFETWHVSVNRLNVSLNSGVQAAVGELQDSFYGSDESPNESVFTNASPESELNTLYERVSDAGLVYQEDTLQYVISDWYNYNVSNHTVTANSESNWLLYSAEGNSYAKMRVANIVQNGFEFTTTFEFDVQAASSTAFNGAFLHSFIVSNQADETCFDFDSGMTVPCDGSEWDIGMENGDIKVNGGASTVSGGEAMAFGPISSSELPSYTAGTDVPLVAYSADAMGGVFSEHTWYAYNLLSRHQIWPNYRVYVVDTDVNSTEDPLIKLQLINYYNEAGTSGYVTVRFMNLDDGGQ